MYKENMTTAELEIMGTFPFYESIRYPYLCVFSAEDSPDFLRAKEQIFEFDNEPAFDNVMFYSLYRVFFLVRNISDSIPDNTYVNARIPTYTIVLSGEMFTPFDIKFSKPRDSHELFFQVAEYSLTSDISGIFPSYSNEFFVTQIKDEMNQNEESPGQIMFKFSFNKEAVL